MACLSAGSLGCEMVFKWQLQVEIYRQQLGLQHHLEYHLNAWSFSQQMYHISQGLLYCLPFGFPRFIYLVRYSVALRENL